MDKKTQRILKQYSVTEDDLRSVDASFSMDVSGIKNFVIDSAQRVGVLVIEENTKQLSAGELYNMIANAASIISLLEMISEHMGASTQVTIAIGGILVAMPVAKAIEHFVKQVAAKKK